MKLPSDQVESSQERKQKQRVIYNFGQLPHIFILVQLRTDLCFTHHYDTSIIIYF